MTTYAVIPAAGRASRLKLDTPKIFLPLSATTTVWDELRAKLLATVEHIVLVIAPRHHQLFSEKLAADLQAGLVSLCWQMTPRGMGDAIFCAYNIWQYAETILVVWGDQVGVSGATLQQAVRAHAGAAARVTLPLVNLVNPYVAYEFDQDTLIKVKQQREGDHMPRQGLADVGSFVLSVAGLEPLWQRYLTQQQLGSATGEINFLPFLVFLAQLAWQIKVVPVTDPRECRGVNTLTDLDYFRSIT